MVPPIELSQNSGSVRSSAPLLGEHTEQIMIEIGYTKKQIEDLKNNRII